MTLRGSLNRLDKVVGPQSPRCGVCRQVLPGFPRPAAVALVIGRDPVPPDLPPGTHVTRVIETLAWGPGDPPGLTADEARELEAIKAGLDARCASCGQGCGDISDEDHDRLDALEAKMMAALRATEGA